VIRDLCGQDVLINGYCKVDDIIQSVYVTNVHISTILVRTMLKCCHSILYYRIWQY
jgi:hypothetical protein